MCEWHKSDIHLSWPSTYILCAEISTILFPTRFHSSCSSSYAQKAISETWVVFSCLLSNALYRSIHSVEHKSHWHFTNTCCLLGGYNKTWVFSIRKTKQDSRHASDRLVRFYAASISNYSNLRIWEANHFISPGKTQFGITRFDHRMLTLLLYIISLSVNSSYSSFRTNLFFQSRFETGFH